MPPAAPLLDLSKPLSAQGSYLYRAAHFWLLTNPFNVFASDDDIDEAKKVVDLYKKNKKMPENHDEAVLWAKKYLVDSATHPETGHKFYWPFRMSAFVPLNTLMIGFMLTKYNSTFGTLCWQWVYHTYHTGLTYNYRSSKDALITKKDLSNAYFLSLLTAMWAALFVQHQARHLKKPIIARMAPFVAVSTGHTFGVLMMRHKELQRGTPVFTSTGEVLGNSQVAAQRGVVLTCLSRIAMATPALLLPPLLTARGLKMGWFCRWPLWGPHIFQWTATALCVWLATPLMYALFSEQPAIALHSLENDIADKAKKKNLSYVAFNKGF